MGGVELGYFCKFSPDFICIHSVCIYLYLYLYIFWSPCNGQGTLLDIEEVQKKDAGIQLRKCVSCS